VLPPGQDLDLEQRIEQALHDRNRSRLRARVEQEKLTHKPQINKNSERIVRQLEQGDQTARWEKLHAIKRDQIIKHKQQELVDKEV